MGVVYNSRLWEYLQSVDSRNRVDIATEVRYIERVETTSQPKDSM